MPKNRSLQNYVAKALKLLDYNKEKILEVRGQDIPFLVEEFLKKNKKSIGLTGSDLFREYELENYSSRLKIIKTLVWEDEKALFKKPVLCLLGPKNKTIETLKRNLRVCISSKYKSIAKRYLNLLEERGYTFKKYYVNGSTESLYELGLSDLVIDVVYTGSSIKKSNLQVYDKIFQSDFVIIGGKND